MSSTGYALDFLYVSGYDYNITSLSLDDKGNLSRISISNGPLNPSWIAFHPTGKYLYAASENDPKGDIMAYSRDEKDGSLTLLGKEESGGGLPCFAEVHPNGKWVYSANYLDGYITLFPINQETGNIEKAILNEFSGKLAHQIITDKSGNFVLVACKGSDYIAQYKFNPDTGKLTLNNPSHVMTGQNSGPRHLAFHPSGLFAFLITELSNEIISYSYDPSSGLLTQLQVISSLPEGWSGESFGAEIQVSPDGAYVYGSNRGHNSIIICSFNSENGLKAINWETGDGSIKIPRGFSLDPSGNYLLVANQASDTVITFKRDQETGLLTRISTRDITSQPSFVGFVPQPNK